MTLYRHFFAKLRKISFAAQPFRFISPLPKANIIYCTQYSKQSFSLVSLFLIEIE